MRRKMVTTMYNNGFNLFLARAVFLVYRTFKGNGRRKVPMLLLKTHRQQFFRVGTLIDHRNDVKIFKTLY